jgi:hypothetical protein
MRRVRLWLVSLTMMAAVTPSYAAETADSTEHIPNHPMLSDDLVFTLGVFYPCNTTAAALATSVGGVGTDINFEDALDLGKRSVVPTVGVFWRATDNYRVDIEHFDISRDATRILAADVQWGDLTFNSGTSVDSSFDFSDLRISAAYSFFKRQDKELGVGLGLPHQNSDHKGQAKRPLSWGQLELKDQISTTGRYRISCKIQPQYQLSHSGELELAFEVWALS